MKKDFGTLFWLHLMLIIAAWLSPLWIDWKLIFAGTIALSIQYLIVGGCVLTFMETGRDTKMTFYYYYLSKIFPALNKTIVFIVVRFILPLLILGCAVLLQVYFNYQPLLHISL